MKIKKVFEVVLILFSVSLFAQDLDALFDKAEDCTAELLLSAEEKKEPLQIPFFIPLTFSGKLTADLGAAYVRTDTEGEEVKNSAKGYFDFENYLYLNARADKNFAFKASFLTEFPSFNFSVYEMYFDYLLLDKLYITGGKKYISWGYPRLFKDDENVKKENVITFYSKSNVLFDSRNCVSVMLRLPVWTGTLTGLALYSGTEEEPDMDDLSFAGSAEFTFFNTSLNLFARKSPEANKYIYSYINDEYGNEHVDNKNGQAIFTTFIEGLEIKRTFLGADIYAQGLLMPKSFTRAFKYLKDFDNDYLAYFVGTGGFYYWWDKGDPVFGGNLEYQYSYSFDSSTVSHSLGFDLGVKRLGPKRNIKVGAEGRFSFSSWQGYIEPGIIVSNAFPYCDWQLGAKYSFNKIVDSENSLKEDKLVIGSYLKFKLNY